MLKLFEIGVEGGEQENDGEVLAETEEIPYECGPRHKYPMLFDEPVHLQVSELSLVFIILFEIMFYLKTIVF